jgi:hypothetical protein
MSSNDESVDSLMEDMNAPEIPMDSKSEGDVSDYSSELEDTINDAFLSLDRDGKQIKLDQNKAKAYAQKGFDYETKMHNLRVEKQMFDRERQKQEESYKELKEINDFAKQNPEWERFLHEQWSSRQNQQAYQGNPAYQGSNPEMSKVAFLENQLNNVMRQLDSQREDMTARQTAELDSKIQGEIDNYKEQYSDFDWASEDEIGLTLESRIQQHALDNRIPNFVAAARDYLWDEHMKRASMNSKEQVGKAVQRQNALGLGKVTKTSQMQAKEAKGVRSKSYSDLAAEALAEYGLS